jgi:hypothetical protein
MSVEHEDLSAAVREEVRTFSDVNPAWLTSDASSPTGRLPHAAIRRTGIP